MESVTVISFPRCGCPPKMMPRIQYRIVKEVKTLECLIKTFRNLIAACNISVDTSTICKTLSKDDVHGKCPQRKPLLSKIHLAAQLIFTKKVL